MDNELDYKYVITFIIIVKKKKKDSVLMLPLKKSWKKNKYAFL